MSQVESMLRIKLRAYIASTCLASTFSVGVSLQPAYAKSLESSRSSNLSEESALNSSSPNFRYRALLQDRDIENYPFRFDQNEVQNLDSLDGTVDEHVLDALDSILNSQIEGETSDASINEQALDNILNGQFEQRAILLARCCA